MNQSLDSKSGCEVIREWHPLLIRAPRASVMAQSMSRRRDTHNKTAGRSSTAAGSRAQGGKEGAAEDGRVLGNDSVSSLLRWVTVRRHRRQPEPVSSEVNVREVFVCWSPRSTCFVIGYRDC